MEEVSERLREAHRCLRAGRLDAAEAHHVLRVCRDRPDLARRAVALAGDGGNTP